MSWQDELQPATWRGLSFHVIEAPAEIGRRVEVHEYPLRDEPYAEDLGRKARRYSFDAFLLGDDALGQRDKFEEALEQSGPGVLVHPYYGAVQVQLDTAQPRYSSRKRGQVSYRLSFVEAGKEKFPETEIDTLSKVDEAVNEALIAAQDDFTEKLKTKGPAYLLETAQKWLNRGLGGLRTLNARANAFMQPISEIAATIDAIGNELSTLILLPRTLATKITSAIGAILGVGDDIQRALDGYKHLGITIGDIESVPLTTPSRIQQAKNRAAIINLVSTVATLEAVRSVAIASQARDVKVARSINQSASRSIFNSATANGLTSNSPTVTSSTSGELVASSPAETSPFTSYQHAITVRDELIQALDDIALTATDDLYVAISDVQVQLQRHIAAHGARLQRIGNHSLIVSQPALVLAHNLYGDAARADDIVARNQISHPGFLPAGQDLEVLNG